MGQFGFFDADKRLAVISAKGDPLEMIDRVVPFESFRAEIEAVTLTPASEKKSNAGRKPIDVIVLIKFDRSIGSRGASLLHAFISIPINLRDFFAVPLGKHENVLSKAAFW